MSQLEFQLPDVGEGLTEAEIVEWLVAPGSEVRADQPVVIVETAKAQVELPAPADGVIRNLTHNTGEMVEVGATLYVLDTGVEPATASEPNQVSAGDATVTSQAEPETTHAGTAPSNRGRRRVLAAPSTRRLAVEHGVEIADLTGSGPGGRIVRSDVQRAIGGGDDMEPDRGATLTSDTVSPASGAAPELGTDEVRSLRGLRRQVARAMTEAWSVPHITEFREIDATTLEQAHQALRTQAQARGERLTLLPLLVRILVAALHHHPELNATLDMSAETVAVHRDVDLSIAVATADGLMVPVLCRASSRSLPELGREIARLSQGARARSLPVEETRGGSFTVSNFGSYGTWLGTPMINPPQVAIAGFGKTREAVVAVDGAPAVRRVLPVAVAADHRLIDGKDLGNFLNTLESLMTNPLLLLGEEVY